MHLSFSSYLPKFTKKSYARAEEVLGLTHSPAHARAQLLPNLLAAPSLRENPVVLFKSSFFRSTAAEQAEEHADAHARGRLALRSSSARPQAVGASTPAAPEELAKAAESSPPRGPRPSATQAATVRPDFLFTTRDEEEGGEEEVGPGEEGEDAAGEEEEAAEEEKEAADDAADEEEEAAVAAAALEEASLSSISSIAYFLATEPLS